MTKTAIQQVDLNNLDKSDWQTFGFHQFAKSVSERVDPNNTHLDVYIGLEHIDSESLHVRRFGTPDDVNGQKLKFYPGDVIFGKRRAYQRKAAVVSVEGFCSAHAMVLRADSDVIDPRLFPFFLHSDAFMHRAIDISVGSLSPTINWKTLREQKFLLPPKEQQAEIAELLWAMDEVIQKEVRLYQNAGRALSSEVESVIHGERLVGRTINEVLEELSMKTEVVSLMTCGEIFKGKGIPKKDVVELGVPCIRYGELYTLHHRIIRQYRSFISSDTIDSAFKLEKNDVLFAGSGETIAEIGKSAAFTFDDDAYAGGDILVFRPDSMDGVFLGYLMNSQLVRQQLNKLGTGATVMHIYKSDLEKIKIPKIEYGRQIEIGKHFESYATSISFIEKNIENSKTLQKSLINQVF